MAFLVVLCLIITESCAYNIQKTENSVAGAVYLEDAREIIRILEEIHPVFCDLPMFANQPSDKYYEAKRVLLSESEKTITPEQFYRLIRRYLASLNDLHTWVDVGGPVLPIPLYWSTEGLYLEPCEYARSGAYILDIGGVSIEEIGLQIDEMYPHENESSRFEQRKNFVVKKNVLRSVGVGVLLDQEQVDVHLFHVSGDEKTVAMSFVKENDRPLPIPTKSFECSIISNKSTALIVAGVLDTDVHWKSMKIFLEEALNNGIKNVIIDLRMCPGGSSNVWDSVLAIMHMRYGSGGKILRNSINGSGYVYARECLNAEPNRDINLILLTSERTSSGAMFLVTAVKDANLGLIVGREPGNNPSFAAGSPQYVLPVSSARYYVSQYYYVRPNPENDGNPLVDIYVAYGDDALEVALEMLRKS